MSEEKCGADCSAISLTSAPESGWGSTPAAMLAQSVTPSTSYQQCTAAMASGTVDMPTASAPSTRAARTSAGVSNCGPGKYM